jgi:hypothetical protein
MTGSGMNPEPTIKRYASHPVVGSGLSRSLSSGRPKAGPVGEPRNDKRGQERAEPSGPRAVVNQRARCHMWSFSGRVVIAGCAAQTRGSGKPPPEQGRTPRCRTLTRLPSTLFSSRDSWGPIEARTRREASSNSRSAPSPSLCFACACGLPSSEATFGSTRYSSCQVPAFCFGFS